MGTSTVHAQDGINHSKLPIDTAYAHQYVGVAESLIKIGRVDSALQYVEDAAAIYMNTKAWKRCAQAYNQIGFELYRIKKFEEAYTLFSNAYHISEKNLPSTNLTLATACNHLGAVYTIKGNYEKALSLHMQALGIQKEISASNKQALVKTYLQIGNVYYQTGNYQKSLNYNNLAFAIQKTSPNTRKAEIAETYNNIGLLELRLENNQAALDNYQQSLDIKQEIYFDSHPRIATTYTDLALSYQRLGLFDKALLTSDNALIILKNTFEENHPDFGVNYQLKGDIHFEQADYKEAIDFYKKALDNRLSGNIEGGAEIAETYLRIAKTYEEQKYSPMAILPYIQKAVQSLVYQFDKEDIFENPELKNVLSDEFLIEAIHYKALMFTYLYNETGSINHLEASLNSYQLAAKLFLKTALQYKIDNRKTITPKMAQATFENGAKTAYQLSKIANPANRNTYINAGFQFSEQFKKYQQLLVLKSGKISAFRGIDKSSLEKEKQLKIDLDFYTKMLLEEHQKGELSNNNTIQHLEKHVEILQEKRNQLLKEYKEKYPNYFKMKYELANVGLEQLQPYLKDFLPETALVAYLLGDSLAYSYTITKDTSFVKEFLLDASLTNKIQDLSNVLSDYQLLKDEPSESYQQYATNAYAVFRSVLSKALNPIKDKANNLVIMRDGGLHYIPFEALLTGVDSRQTPFNELQFLVKTHTLSYAFSAANFLQNMQKKNIGNKEFLGMNKNYVLASMQVDRDEKVVQLSKKLHHNWSNSAEQLSPLNIFENKDIYTDTEATKENFLEIANNYKMAQLALLGLLDDQNPLQSYLLFSSNDVKENYNYLRTSELYNTNLNLDLLVIGGLVSPSAINKGAGITALQQALSYAGCLSTVTSIWENDPITTTILMNYFYQNLKKGMNKAEALSTAKRTLIEKETDKAHPYYWSSYILIGNPKNIEHPIQNIGWTWWAVAGGAILFLLSIFWIGFNLWRNRKNQTQTAPSTPYKEASSTFSSQASASAITSTKVVSSKGDRNLASFTKFKKD